MGVPGCIDSFRRNATFIVILHSQTDIYRVLCLLFWLNLTSITLYNIYQRIIHFNVPPRHVDHIKYSKGVKQMCVYVLYKVYK